MQISVNAHARGKAKTMNGFSHYFLTVRRIHFQVNEMLDGLLNVRVEIISANKAF